MKVAAPDRVTGGSEGSFIGSGGIVKATEIKCKIPEGTAGWPETDFTSYYGIQRKNKEGGFVGK